MYEQMSSFDEFGVRFLHLKWTKLYGILTDFFPIFCPEWRRYILVNVTIIEIGWMAIWNGISEIPACLFHHIRFISYWLSRCFETRQNDVQLTLYFRPKQVNISLHLGNSIVHLKHREYLRSLGQASCSICRENAAKCCS